MSPVEIAAAVRWEAARYHPVPDEMITDYIVTGERSSNGKRVVETGVVSVPREIVAGYLEPVSRAGFRPAGVEIEPLALCRAARFFTGTGDGKRLLLDIGEENSILVIIEEGRYLFSRDVYKRQGGCRALSFIQFGCTDLPPGHLGYTIRGAVRLCGGGRADGRRPVCAGRRSRRGRGVLPGLSSSGFI